MCWVEVNGVVVLSNLNIRMSGIFSRQVDIQAETGVKDREAQFLQPLSYQMDLEFSSCPSG